MAIVLALLACFAVASEAHAQPLPDRPALVITDEEHAGLAIFRTATSYTYDSSGNILTRIETQGFPDAEPFTIRWVASTYDAQNRVTSEIDEFALAGLNWSRERKQWSYDSEGRRTGFLRIGESSVSPISSQLVTFYAYDTSGRIVHEVFAADYDSDGTREEVTRTLYAYDGDRLAARTIVMVFSETEQFVDRLMTYEYDGQERLNRRNEYSNYGASEIPFVKSATDIVYDDEGRAVEESTNEDWAVDGVVDYATTITRSYDTRGSLIEEKTTIDSDPSQPGTAVSNQYDALTYDPGGRLILRIVTTDQWFDPKRTTTYFY